MKNESPERRLAAIVALDVVGYSRLMGTDEEGTLGVLKSHQQALTPLVEHHGGRLVSTAGDGILLEFPSVVEAVNCAIEIQALMDIRNVNIDDDTKMQFRIGINLGDIIIHTDNDVFGDGVNVAARIEQLAPPGGICMSRSVRNQIRDKMDINLEDMGEIEVKNIARPIRVFRVLKDGEVAAKPPRKTPPWQKYAAIAATLIVLIGGGGGWWWQAQPDFEPADPKNYAFKLPEKPSIAVLPFDNLTGDKDQDFIGDGLTENIIAVLAQSPKLFVIARNSSFTFKNKPTKVQDVAEQLGVRYVLEGSVQKSGDKIRVIAQLVDAINGKHLWAQTFDRTTKNLFDLQDEISEKIFLELAVSLVGGNRQRLFSKHYKDFETQKLASLANAEFQKFSTEGNIKAEEYALAALAREPDNFLTNNMLAWIEWRKLTSGATKNPGKTMAVARRYANQALSTNDQSAGAHIIIAWLDLLMKNYDSVIKHVDRAIELDPSGSQYASLAGWAKSASGFPEEGVELLKFGMRTEPFYPTWVATSLARSLMMLKRYDEAKNIYEGVLASNRPEAFAQQDALMSLARIASITEDNVSAQQYVDRALKIQGIPLSISSFKKVYFYIRDQEYLKEVIAFQRKFGIPENPPSKTKPAGD